MEHLTDQPPLPPERITVCSACGRRIASWRALSRYAAPDDVIQGQPTHGLCDRDLYRIRRHGAPVTQLHRAADIAEEVAHLMDTGTPFSEAVDDIARELDMERDSVMLALRRHRRRTSTEGVAA